MYKRLIIFLSLFLCITINYGYSDVVIDKVVAVVGDKFLTLYQLEELCKPYFKKYLTPDLPLQQKQVLKKEIEKKVLNQWIEDTLIELEAKKYHILVTDKELKNYIENEIKSFGGKKNFEDFLKQQGLTLKEYEKRLKQRLLEIKLVQLQVSEKIVITDEELKQAYKEFIKKYPKNYYYVLNIIIANNKEVAEKIYKKLKSGNSCENIVKLYPEQVRFIKDEMFKKEELDPRFLNILEKLKPEDITKPICIDNKFYIIKVVKKSFNKPPSFKEVRAKLYRELFEKKAQNYVKKWIKSLQEKRYIKVFL